ncbi:hypothetical protein FQR65_LT06464 [Abscondita terminalis]|nr:hypothetical protein FQR65_LT06464 [Abscondita terminalis]
MQTMLTIFILVNFGLVSAISNRSVCSVNSVYDLYGDLNVALIVNECANLSPISWTYVNSALWMINRLNTENFTSPLSLGLTVYQACGEDDTYNVVYDIFAKRHDRYFLETYLSQPIDNNINRFVKLLQALDFKNNITVYAENELDLQKFYALTRAENICVKNGVVFETKTTYAFVKPRDGVVVVLAKCETIKEFLQNFSQNEMYEDIKMIFVPTDASINIDIPEGSYVIEPLLSEQSLSKTLRFTPSPLFFDVANPILETIIRAMQFILENCNSTSSKVKCLEKNYGEYFESIVNVSPEKVIGILSLENFVNAFVYNIYRVENLTMQILNSSSPSENAQKGILQSFVNVFKYSVFNSSLTGPELNTSGFERNILCPRCRLYCVNFIPKPPPKTILISYAFSKFGLRTESWVFGFLAVSLLGVLFCIAVFIFIVVRFCKRDIFEGNPFLTVILLWVVVLMYCSVVPFALDSDKEVRNYICVARALSSTLTYALAFSLLLSRSILLATISKEVGFMAHVPGPVQSFLTLFIFGVQGALSLQFINHCEDIFRGNSFVYLMSYNVILLILLLFICPLNTRSQRNYREGRYFTIAIALIACVWSCWLPGYAVFNNDWRDPMVCSGLVSTASILLGSIFIPRTYMMTVAATRDRLTSALPSLQANSSIVDVYRATAQPIYDCINIAAINARCGPPQPPPLPQNEVYSSPTEPYDEEYNFERSVTPNPDKVTRF